MLKIERQFDSEAWRRALLTTGATIGQAIENLNNSAAQITLVISQNGILLGTLTDGDIRRGLLRGLGLDSPIDPIIKSDPLVVPAEMTRETVLQLMHSNRLHQLPIVDGEQRVVGLHLLDDLVAPTLRPNLMLIMAGGRGVRLKPHTEKCPKPLLPVGDKPMLEHIIERARDEGFQHFVLAIHYLGDMIKDYFRDGSRLGVMIDYIEETMPLGTAGAIGLLRPRPKDPFLVSNGDVLTDIHYGELLDFHLRNKALGTMAVRLYEWQHPFGVVKTQGIDIVEFEEKPISRSHINAGIYVLEPSVLEEIREHEACDMPELFVRLRKRGARTIVYPMHEPWLDVGRADDYNSAQQRKR